MDAPYGRLISASTAYGMRENPAARTFVLWGGRRGDVQIGSPEDRGIQAFLKGVAASMRFARQFADGMERLRTQATPAADAVAKLTRSLRRLQDDGVPTPVPPLR